MTKTKEIGKKASKDESAKAPRPEFLTRKERLAVGKALRDKVPHEQHSTWNPSAKRRNPIDVLEESNRDRLPELVPIRYGRMLRSPFTFLRGSAGLMAYDLSTTPQHRPAGAGVRRLSPAEFRPVRHTGAQPGLRHQRFRRDPASALGVGCQTPGRKFCGGRS